ncbi:MAG: HIT domain-containing protein [Caldisericia bacterium]|jgi:histidine triad (HIT) family protein
MMDANEQDCVFCRISRHEAPAEYLYEDVSVFVIKDRFPKAPVHLLVIPRKHIARIDALSTEDNGLIVHLFEVIRLVAVKYHLDAGYRVIINSGAEGGQTVSHLHVHIIAGRCLGFREDVAR